MSAALLAVLATFAAAPAPAEEAPVTSSWSSCPDLPEGGRKAGHYLLGRYANGIAVVEAENAGTPHLAKLWAHAVPGGTQLTWPGGRPGVRHLADPKLFAGATAAAQTGHLYVWTSANGWRGGDAADIIGIEMAKSLCDARDLVVYIVLQLKQPGSGFAVASLIPPAEDADAPSNVPADPSAAVISRLYTNVTAQVEAGLKTQRLAPASLAVNIYPGHFSADAPQYAVSLRWSNAFDDRFSQLYIADKDGLLARQVDRQEGGAGGTLSEAADLDGDGYTEMFYEVTTLEGSAVALWSMKGGRLRTIVQTTPVGD